eukprot:TRINITY_DN2931_c1_g1_i1.p1 TRINITY_DN2931_c1_g1~~TRINITY_DN2931_c1_g1_i1.p1  ORF type:complete len:487 (+),score=109.13 TRINITY_DN2931_c1_g1_i1:83-1543(+)
MASPAPRLSEISLPAVGGASTPPDTGRQASSRQVSFEPGSLQQQQRERRRSRFAEERGDPSLRLAAAGALPQLDVREELPAVVTQLALRETPTPVTPGELIQYVKEPKGAAKTDMLAREALLGGPRRRSQRQSRQVSMVLDVVGMREACQRAEDQAGDLETALEDVREMRVTDVSEFAFACAQFMGVQKAKKKFLKMLKNRGQGPTKPQQPWWKERADADIERRKQQRKTGRRVQVNITTPGGPPLSLPGDKADPARRVDYVAMLKEQERAHGVLVTNDRSYQRMLRKYEGIQALLKRRLSAICRGEDLGPLPADLSSLRTPRGSIAGQYGLPPQDAGLPEPEVHNVYGCSPKTLPKSPNTGPRLPPLQSYSVGAESPTGIPFAESASPQRSVTEQSAADTLPLHDFGLLRHQVRAAPTPQPLPSTVPSLPDPLRRAVTPSPTILEGEWHTHGSAQMVSRLPEGAKRQFAATPLPAISSQASGATA